MEAKIKMGTCPVCGGSGRVPAVGLHASVRAGYDRLTHTHPCNNCGGQTMICRGTGRVFLRPDGTPCKHEYTHELLGNCYHGYTCKHCGDIYTIDSGD